MSQTLAMELPNKIKAIGVVASNFGADEVNKIKDVQPFSILFIHGTNDPIFPYEKGVIEAFNTKRGRVLGIEQSIDFMCKLNGNNKEVITIPIENTNVHDDCISERTIYPNPENPSLKVEHIKVKSGGHLARRKRTTLNKTACWKNDSRF